MLTRTLRFLTQSPDGLLHMPPAMDTITSQGTAIGAALAATTVASGDSFQVKNAALTSDVWMLNFWTHNLVAGMVRIRSPKMHDNVDALRARTLIATLDPLLPLGTKHKFIPQDTMIVELAGSAVGGNIESVVQLMYYADLPGQAGRFIDHAALWARQKSIIGVRLAITLGTTVGYNGARAINGDVDQLHANTDYAVLGMTSDINTAALCLRGPDTGNLRASVPGSVSLWQLVDRWFVKLSDEYKMPLIPVINSANKGATLIDAVNNQAGGTANVTIYLAELGQ
ncbi:MAG TPA: hypothetical protein VGY48_12525 [Vicinamibacterales bacterium]|jgi:hypothetical protein|nr:hypothetical protein [Vicinamibacterales bacterium]